MRRGSIKIGFCEDEDVSLDVTCEVRFGMTKLESVGVAPIIVKRVVKSLETTEDLEKL
jgi:hypothetical protein